MLLFQMEDDEQEADKCNCLPDCNSIEYRITVIKSSIKPEYQKTTVDNVTQYIGEPIIYGGLSFSFGDIEYYALKRYANYRTVSFISEVGGLLSLFLGVSVMSFIEIFYFFGFRVVIEIVGHLKSKRKPKKISPVDLSATLNELDF